MVCVSPLDPNSFSPHFFGQHDNPHRIHVWYILLTALASFCVRGHSCPGSICRILGTIYRIPETIYRIPEAIYCIILILAFFCFQTPGPILKKNIVRPKQSPNHLSTIIVRLWVLSQCFKLPRLLVVYY